MRPAGSRKARRWLLGALSAAVLALATWSRNPDATIIASPPETGERSGAAADEARDATADLRTELGEAVDLIERAAHRALDAPAESEAAFDALPAARAGDPEWGLVLYARGRPFAWSGRVRVATDTLTQPLSVITGEFYTTVNVVARRGERRAVASLVMHAEPPADRLAVALDERVVERHAVATFAYTTGGESGYSAILSRGDTVLLSAESIPLSPGEIVLRARQERQTQAVVLLALLVLLLLWTAFRRRSVVERIAALMVVAAALSIAPLNAFSNGARLFNPSFYYSPIGGRWSASAGALLVSATLILLLVFSILRARLRIKGRLLSAASALASFAAGLALLQALSAGIAQPARGGTVALWLSWEIPLFLTCFAFFLLGGWLLSCGVFSQRTVRNPVLLGLAVVAGILSAAAVWNTTTRQRMVLAEADVEALARGDAYAEALVLRARQQLEAAQPPRTRPELMREFVRSELAVAGFPLSLAAWDSRGGIIARFDAARVSQDTAAIAAAVSEAIATGMATSRDIRGATGAQQLLVVPHDSGATSVAVIPRTRLVAPDPFAALLGTTSLAGDQPPYTLYLADQPPGGARPSEIVWRRGEDHVHFDIGIETVNGPARLHVGVDTRSWWALGQRLGLVVLLDIVIAWLAWSLAVTAEGGALRRFLVRLRHWRRSYRARLTIALFVFFIAPALAFSLWSYRRLRTDFRQTRQLVVREALNAVTAAGADRNLNFAGERFGLPLFIYRDGVLSETSDPLFDALVPAGRTLPSDVHLSLFVGDEISASYEQRLGDADVLFGYRASTDVAGERYVIAAPARSDDDLLTRRRRDLTVLLLFATAMGALGALWLSGIAARQFAYPIASLRKAVRAVARGEHDLPLPATPPSEFSQVFTAFRRMAGDLEESRRELARAERVLAWGEMARQVAHEIKNPLTPIRLGVQHLQRARTDPRVDFDRVFDENVETILKEIDRLDQIARAFARYGSAPPDLPPPQPVDVPAILADLVALERMAGGSVAWRLSGADRPVLAMATYDELREVVLNLLENARLANARTIAVVLVRAADKVNLTIADDGVGIPESVLPRVFEPRFSTRTTGSGLGLAVSRRLIEAWGGSIELDSIVGKGTTVRITLHASGETT